MTTRAPKEEQDDGKKKALHGSQKRQRVKVCNVGMTEGEFTEAQSRAGKAGLSMAAYGRACILGDKGPRARRSPSVNRALLAEAIAALNRAGNNLNQIAHHMNAGGHPDRVKVGETLEGVGGCLQHILDALGRAE